MPSFKLPRGLLLHHLPSLFRAFGIIMRQPPNVHNGSLADWPLSGSGFPAGMADKGGRWTEGFGINGAFVPYKPRLSDVSDLSI